MKEIGVSAPKTNRRKKRSKGGSKKEFPRGTVEFIASEWHLIGKIIICYFACHPHKAIEFAEADPAGESWLMALLSVTLPADQAAELIAEYKALTASRRQQVIQQSSATQLNFADACGRQLPEVPSIQKLTDLDFNLWCTTIYDRPYANIVGRALGGSREDLKTLLTIDKEAIDHPWLRKVMLEAAQRANSTNLADKSRARKLLTSIGNGISNYLVALPGDSKFLFPNDRRKPSPSKTFLLRLKMFLIRGWTDTTAREFGIGRAYFHLEDSEVLRLAYDYGLIPDGFETIAYTANVKRWRPVLDRLHTFGTGILFSTPLVGIGVDTLKTST